MTLASAVEAARLAYGSAQLVAPRRLAEGFGSSPSTDTVILLRVLGARHVVQGLLLLALDSRSAHRVGAAVDGLHAASVVPLGRRACADRRLAVLDGCVASALCLTEARLR